MPSCARVVLYHDGIHQHSSSTKLCINIDLGNVFSLLEMCGGVQAVTDICIPRVLYTVLSTRSRLFNIYIRSTLDTSQLVSSAHNFKDKLLARQVEMRELIRWSIIVVISTISENVISPLEWPNRNGGMLHKLNLYWSCTALLIALQYVGINNIREMCVTFRRISIQ